MSNNERVRRLFCSRESAEEALEAVIRSKVSGAFRHHSDVLLEALVDYNPKAINRIIPHLTFRQCLYLQHVLYLRTSLVNKIDERYPTDTVVRDSAPRANV